MSARASNGQFLPGTHWRPHAAFRERHYLAIEYTEKKRSAKEIALEHGVTENAILHWLGKLDIPRRTMSETRAAKHWGASGALNPMFGRTGALNPNFVDGSSPERQRMYARHEWRTLAAYVYKRDDFCCRRCTLPRAAGRKLTAHHVHPWAGNPSLRFAESNIVSLCTHCHRWVHSNANARKEWLA